MKSVRIFRPVLWFVLFFSLTSCGLMESQRDAEAPTKGKPRCGAITWESC